jgi:hypothetical protein
MSIPRRTLTYGLVMIGMLAGARQAAAQPPKPGLVMPKGKVNLAVNVEISTSSDAVGEPVSIAPDASYGVTPDLTVMLVHSTFLTTGFRGAAGKGLCVTGTDAGCAELYDNVGAEAVYQVVRGELQVAADVGFHALGLDAGFYAAKLGAKLRYTAGKLAFNAMPAVYVAATERGTDVGEQRDTYWVPVQAVYKATPELAVGLGTGIKGSLEQAGDSWNVPLGCMATYALSPQLSAGASFVFGKLLAADAVADPKGVDQSAVQLWVGYTL